MPQSQEFRSEAESEQFDSHKKRFISILPPGSFAVGVFFFMLISSLVAGLFLIKIPVKLEGIGSITSGSKSIQVSVPASNLSVKSIHVATDDKVSKNQPLFTLGQEHQAQSKLATESISKKIKHLTDESKLLNDMIKSDEKSYNDMLRQQDSLIAAIEDHLIQATEFESEAAENLKKGLTSRFILQDEKDNTAAIRTQLEDAKADKLALAQEFENKTFLNRQQLKQNQLSLLTLQEELRTHDDIIVTSPCDCTVGQIFTEKGSLTQLGKAAIMLTKKAPNNTADILISTKAYKPVKIGDTVLIKPKSYPSLKYGMITSQVTHVFADPLSPEDYDKPLPEEEQYFRAIVAIDKTPPGVTLQYGMNFKAEVIIDHQTIAQFIFE